MASAVTPASTTPRSASANESGVLQNPARSEETGGADRDRVFEASELTWSQAQQQAEGQTETSQDFTDEKREKEIETYTKKLAKALGPQAFSDPRRAEITGEAILRISSRFLELAAWSPEVQDAMKQALAMFSGDVLADLEDDFE